MGVAVAVDQKDVEDVAKDCLTTAGPAQLARTPSTATRARPATGGPRRSSAHPPRIGPTYPRP